MQKFKYSLEEIYETLIHFDAPDTLNDEEDNATNIITASVQAPIINSVDQHASNNYPGRQNIRYRRGLQNTKRNNYVKPNTNHCPACNLNNYDIIKNVNMIHTCKSNECPFRGPARMPVKATREHVIQYNLKNKDLPPKYDSNITLYNNDKPKPPKIHQPKVHFIDNSNNVDDNEDIIISTDEISIASEDINTNVTTEQDIITHDHPHAGMALMQNQYDNMQDIITDESELEEYQA